MIIDVKDRLAENPGRVTMVPVPGKANTYDQARADDPMVEGTRMNRELFMKMQGFEPTTTTLDGDEITEVGTTGTLKTVLNSDGSVTETFIGLDGAAIRKTTVINPDGSISVTIG